MVSGEWESRWAEGRTGFHREDVNDKLIRHADALLVPDTFRVLVPLCGKSLDLRWLHQRGVQVVGVEAVPRAVASFFSENGLQPEREVIDSLTRYTAGEIQILQGDFFSVEPHHVGVIDAIYDRAALIAIPPSRREEYIAKLLGLLRPGGRLLLLTYDMPLPNDQGPPYRVPIEDVPGLFPAAAEVELLEQIDHSPETEPRLKERGVPWAQEGVFLIRV